MRIQFLGTSSGVPTRTRSLSAVALRADRKRQWLLVDCGEGTQHRLLHTGFSLATLECICITHRHGDHCLGLPGLLSSASMDGRQAPLTIVAPDEVRAFVNAALELTDSRLSYPLEFVDVAAVGPDCPVASGLAVRATPLSHRVPSFGYSFTEIAVEHRLDHARLEAAGIARGPIWGRLQRGQDVQLANRRVLRATDFLAAPRKPRRIVIGGDNDSPELLADDCRDAQLLVHEATYTAEIATRVGPAPMHSSAERVARFAAEAGLPNLVLTHFSPRYGDSGGAHSLDELAREAATYFGGSLHLARDLDCFELDSSGRLRRLIQPPAAAG